MKKLIVGIMFLGLASLGFSQEIGEEVKEVELTGVTVSPIINSVYLDEVRDEFTPVRIQVLEEEVARYDVRKSDFYDGGLHSYVVRFIDKKGRIVATFDHEGNILYAFEFYKNVRMPSKMMSEIYRNHSGWVPYETKYIVNYAKRKGVKKFYKVSLAKNDIRKKLKLSL
ncbi:hypothetical protein [Arenibacter certesii]|uniref:DUF4468 domain-containing protein n=1 Tax=Arenibacter certesii TaxID=228955 RepID=A0A918IS57_9FLAO|nr:hypothetical protein [Arenibacter certesii]GGW29722.1 hypothetical protein GCM10007383_13710 [Arenibacter certesii]